MRGHACGLVYGNDGVIDIDDVTTEGHSGQLLIYFMKNVHILLKLL
jgi:hypothetical protein